MLELLNALGTLPITEKLLTLFDLIIWFTIPIYSLYILNIANGYKDCLRLQNVRLFIMIDSMGVLVISIFYLLLRFSNFDTKLLYLYDHMMNWMTLDYCLGGLLLYEGAIKLMIFRWICNRGNRCHGNKRIPFTILSEARLARMKLGKIVKARVLQDEKIDGKTVSEVLQEVTNLNKSIEENLKNINILPDIDLEIKE